MPAVDALLREQRSAISEYDLMCQLKEEYQCFSFLSDSPNLALFQKHFLLMNALYELQETLYAQGEYLHISPLKIHLQKLNCSGQTMPATEREILRDYYLDWDNLTGTTDKDVHALLESFWRNFNALTYTQEQTEDAWAVLGLAPGTDWQTIQRTYRLRIAKEHPDKGGNNDRFIALREAYEVLRKVCAQ